jgi:hypothetical protein
VLLDLDAGWLRYYRNGKRCGPGFTEGVTGPLLRVAQLVKIGKFESEAARGAILCSNILGVFVRVRWRFSVVDIIKEC